MSLVRWSLRLTTSPIPNHLIGVVVETTARHLQNSSRCRCLSLHACSLTREASGNRNRGAQLSPQLSSVKMSVCCVIDKKVIAVHAPAGTCTQWPAVIWVDGRTTLLRWFVLAPMRNMQYCCKLWPDSIALLCQHATHRCKRDSSSDCK